MQGQADLPMVDFYEPDAGCRLADALRRYGIAVVEGVSSRADAHRLARCVVTAVPRRDSDPDGITTIMPRAEIAHQEGFAGFGDGELRPHTEGSTLAAPPRILLLTCVRPARSGGHTLLVDGAAVYDDVVRNDSEMLAALCVPRSAFFGGSGGYLGSVFEPTSEGRVTVRMRQDRLVRFAPRTSRYANRLSQFIAQRTRITRLAEGDCVVLANDRWLHGRTRFTGSRVMFRILGDPLPALGMFRGFAPAIVSPSPGVARALGAPRVGEIG